MADQLTATEKLIRDAAWDLYVEDALQIIQLQKDGILGGRLTMVPPSERHLRILRELVDAVRKG